MNTLSSDFNESPPIPTDLPSTAPLKTYDKRWDSNACQQVNSLNLNDKYKRRHFRAA
jgi:hypothetical protein